MVAIPRLKSIVDPAILPIAGVRIIGLMPFRMVLALCEKQTVLFRILTQEAESTFHDDIHNLMSTNKNVYTRYIVISCFIGK